MKEHLFWKFLKNSFIHCPNQKCTRLSWSVSRNLTDISVLDKPQLFAVEPCKHLHMCVAPLLLTILFCSTIYSALTHSTTIAICSRQLLYMISGIISQQHLLLVNDVIIRSQQGC